jgi:hypothetical protein
MTGEVSIPGGRSVRGTIDRARSGPTADDSTETRPAGCVVACPPHPQHGGHRGDPRLEAVSDGLTERGIDCVRIDYGNWDGGYGEREDACNAVRWASKRYDHVGLFGFSFGGAIALLAGARVSGSIDAVATLAPASSLGADDDLSVLAALAELCASTALPIQIAAGERDSTVNSMPLIDRLRDRDWDRQPQPADHEIELLPADHFFVGQHDTIATLVGDFLAGRFETSE